MAIKTLALTLTFILLSLPALAGGPVALDAGHGGHDPGLQAGDIREKDTLLGLAKEVKNLLEGTGTEVLLVRKADRYLGLMERARIVEGSGSRLLLSLHLSNSDQMVLYTMWYAHSSQDMPLRDFYSVNSTQHEYLSESKRLASALGAAIKSEFGYTVKTAEMPLGLLGQASMPAVMVEIPAKALASERDVFRLAATIVLGIQDYGQ